MRIKLSDHFTYKRLLKYTLAPIAMMIFTSIYSVVDGFFVSNFAGKSQFTAVNFIYPVIMILGTVGFMFGTGGTALVAKTYGEGDKEKANRYFSLIVYFSFALGVVVAVPTFIFIRQIASLMGAKGELLENCVIYARILIAAVPFFILQVMFHSFFSVAEKPSLGFIITVAAGMTNIILDAVLVLSLPQNMKLAGAAIATALSQFIGGIVPLIYFLRKNNSVLRLGKTEFYGKALLKSCGNGSSEFMSNIAMNVVGILYNIQLMNLVGENGVAAYGVMMYVSLVFSGAFIGFTVGSAPIVGYHYGANNRDELKSLLQKSLRIVALFGVCMVMAAELLAVPIAKLFVAYDKNLYDITLRGFRIYALSFLFMGFGIFTSGFFTALSDGLTSALISFIRTMVFQTAAIIILPVVLGVKGIWLSIVVAEFMSLVLGVTFLIVKRKKYGY